MGLHLQQYEWSCLEAVSERKVVEPNLVDQGRGHLHFKSTENLKVMSSNKRRTKNDNMPYPNVLQRASILIHKDFIHLVKRVQSLNDMSENGVFAVQVVNLVTESDKKLTSAAPFVALQGWSYSHRDCAFMRMLHLWEDFWREVS